MGDRDLVHLYYLAVDYDSGATCFYGMHTKGLGHGDEDEAGSYVESKIASACSERTGFSLIGLAKYSGGH